MTPQQARALAFLVNAVRPDWDEHGILAQLHKLDDRPLADVIVAATYAASTRRDQRTPAIIAASGNHWRDAPQHEPTEQPPRFQVCPEHQVREPCPACRQSIPDADTITRHAAAARAAIRATSRKLTPEGEPDA